jgi:hypothetical protein
MIDKKQLIEELLDCVKDATDTDTQITGLSMCAMLMNEVIDEALILTGVSHRRELCEGKCGMSYCDDNGCLNKKEILGEPKDTSIVE